MISEVSMQYAKALFELTTKLEDKHLDYENLIVLSNLLKEEQIQKVLKHPLIPLDEKKNLLLQTFEDKVPKHFMGFILVLLDNGRLDITSDIANAYLALLDEVELVLRVEVISKYPLSNDATKQLIKILRSRYHKMIVLNPTIDANLLGGAIIKIGNDVFDATFDNALLEIKNHLKG